MPGTESRPSTYIPQEELTTPPEKLEDRCGLVSIRSFEPAAHFDNLIRGAYGVQHRGQLGVGIRMVEEDGSVFPHTGDGLISRVFTDDFIFEKGLLNKKGKLSGFHCRYGTEGNYGESNLQPILKRHYETDTEIAVFHNGQFVNIDKMKEEVGDDVVEGASDTQLFAEMLARSEGTNWDQRILSTLDKVDGAYNLIIHLNDTMYVARDKFGLHPLEIGRIKFPETEGIIVASETSAFNETGATHERRVRRGEVFRVDDDGFTQIRKGYSANDQGADREAQECGLEIAYLQRSDSLDSEGQAIANKRQRFGENMAERVKIPNASFVIGLPDSGIDIAIGYANAAGVPYRQYIKRNHYSPHGSQRAFQTDYDIPNIRSVVAKKLLYIPGPHWKNAVVVVGDDSAVRGSGSTEVTSRLYGLGAKEVHWIIGFPPVKDTCHLAISIRTREELIANQGDVAALIGAKSVNYILPEEYVKAYKGSGIKNPSNPSEIFLENNLCGGCLTGVHPISKDGTIWQSSGQMKSTSQGELLEIK